MTIQVEVYKHENGEPDEAQCIALAVLSSWAFMPLQEPRGHVACGGEELLQLVQIALAGLPAVELNLRNEGSATYSVPMTFDNMPLGGKVAYSFRLTRS